MRTTALASTEWAARLIRAGGAAPGAGAAAVRAPLVCKPRQETIAAAAAVRAPSVVIFAMLALKYHLTMSSFVSMRSPLALRIALERLLLFVLICGCCLQSLHRRCRWAGPRWWLSVALFFLVIFVVHLSLWAAMHWARLYPPMSPPGWLHVSLSWLVTMCHSLSGHSQEALQCTFFFSTRVRKGIRFHVAGHVLVFHRNPLRGRSRFHRRLLRDRSLRCGRTSCLCLSGPCFGSDGADRLFSFVSCTYPLGPLERLAFRLSGFSFAVLIRSIVFAFGC
jgi:hypothetical protein